MKHFRPQLRCLSRGARLISIGFPGDAVNHIVVVRVKDGAATCKMVKIQE